MNKIINLLLYYTIAIILVMIIHEISPTNLAGLGWDIVVYILSVIISIALLGRSLVGKMDGVGRTRMVIINLVGTLLVFALVYYVSTR